MADKSVTGATLTEVEAIYRGHLAEFRRVAAAISGDRNAAADLVEEAFLRAVRELDGFHGSGSLHGWLWRIVVNLAENHRRDSRALAELPADLPASTNGHGPSEFERVRVAVGLLPERQQFNASPGQQSWDAFPTGTKLLMLVSGEAGGRRYALYGFRSGNSLCLTLDEGGQGYSYRPGCAAASTLAQLNSPVVPIDTGSTGASGRLAGPPPEVSVGIVADGVSSVSVNATGGTHPAWVGGDAYLWVEDQPNTGNQVLSFTAVSHGGGKQTTVQAPTAPGSFGPVAPPPPARGPAPRLADPVTPFETPGHRDFLLRGSGRLERMLTGAH